MATKRTSGSVAEICLYGNHETGAGWLARTADGAMLGDGEPRVGRSNTEAVWQACDEVRRSYAPSKRLPHQTTVRIFAPGGRRMADTTLGNPGYFGDLKWQAATVLEISAEAIEAAATKV